MWIVSKPRHCQSEPQHERRSRRGCINCKRRHVKCDEQVPCGNCIRRNEGCSLLFIRGGGTSPSFTSEDSYRPDYASPEMLRQSAALTQKAESWAEDLYLMHNFSSQTSLTLVAHREVQHLWQDWIPGEATTHLPLMHGLLAVSSLHLACVHQDRSPKFYLLSSKHYGRALESMRAALPVVTDENCHAMFALANLISLYYIADFSRHDYPEPSIGDICTIFKLISGQRNMLGPSYETVINGPFKVMLRVEQTAEFLRKRSERSSLPLHVVLQFDSLYGLVRTHHAGNATGLAAALDALYGLEKVYEMRFRTLFDDRFSPEVAWAWIGSLSPDFMALLLDHDPVALALLAHFSVLSTYCEKQWYATGWCTNSMRAIRDALDPKWADLLKWPDEQIANNFKAFNPNVEQGGGELEVLRLQAVDSS